MATKRAMTPPRRFRPAGWLGLALAVLLSAVTGGGAQEATRPERSRAILTSAIDTYKRGDYETASVLFARAQLRGDELEPSDRTDLETFGAQNGIALKARKDGSVQIRQAEDALNAGRHEEAAKLLRAATVNQYLAPGERQVLAHLAARLQKAAQSPLSGPKADPKTLLAAARAALKDGDLTSADALAGEAEKAGGTGSWLQPWADTPAKVRRDVEAVRGKATPPIVVRGPATTADKQDSGWPLPALKNPFAKEAAPSIPPPARPAGSPAAAPIMAQDVPAPPFGPMSPYTAQPPNLTAPASVDVGMPPVAQVGAGSDHPASPYTAEAMPAAAPVAPPRKGSPPTADKKALARQFLAQGYQAMQVGDLDGARQMAFRARDLNVDLDRNELGPDQLLQEIQRKAVAAVASSKAPLVPADSRALVKEGRALLRQKKLDEAEKACSEAAAVPNTRWGLFEDSPERLRGDILRAKAQHNRDESVKLLADAHKLFRRGQYEDARKKAWKAQELHGPYGAFDFGERPQRLIVEIARAEKKLDARQPQQPKAPPETQIAKKDPATPPVPTARSKAAALLSEARELERRGQLVEAQQKASEAKKLAVNFAPGEDSPEAVMLTLSARCKVQIQTTLGQVTVSVSNQPGDPARLQKAQADLAAALQLARQFGLDAVVVEQKMAWLQQTAGGGEPLTKVAYQAAADPAMEAKHRAGLERLDKARLELKAGNYTVARKLAEEAYDPAAGTQKDAEMVLRDIDAEEHAQRLLAAQRSFQAGIDAFLQGDHQRAGSILVNVDTRLLPPQQQARLREIMSTRELQPASAVAQAGHKELLKANVGEKGPGVAVAGEQSDEPLDQVRAMEKIQFEQMYQRNLQAQKSALELFKAGQGMKAIDVLNVQLAQVDQGLFAPEQSRQLKSPLEKRLDEFRRMQASDLLNKQRAGVGKTGWSEGKYQEGIKHKQDEVGDMVKQCSALAKEGKNKEALAMAYKAKELDPDNLAAGAYIQMISIKVNQKKYDDDKYENQDMFIEGLRNGNGKMPTDDQPFTMSESGVARQMMRKNAPISIWQKTKNPKERAIEYRLDQPIHFGFRDTPLGEVIESLNKLSGVPVYPDSLALQHSSISLDHPLTMDSDGLAMKSALNILLGKMGLTYVIQNESLMITTADKAKANFKQVVYPIADLIVPVENHPVPDVADLTKVLERHMNSQYAMLNYVGASPVNPLHALPPAPPVSSYNGGLGSAFGTTSQSQAQQAPSYSPVQKRATGETMEYLLMDLIKSTVHPHTWKDMGGPGQVQFYPLGMVLVVNQTQEVQGDIVDLLAALRRLQDMEVAIEMRLVSVSESFYERIGVDFDVNLKTPSNPGAENQLLNSSFTPFGTVNRNLQFKKLITGLTPAGTLTPDLNIPIRNSSFNFSTPPFGGYTAPGVDGGLSLGLAFLSDIQVFMILEAAQGDRRTNIMQAPKITVFNGQTANIRVQTTQFVNLGITAIPVNGQILFQPNNTALPIGVTLQVTPVVSADRRFVRLNLTPTMTNLISNDIPVFPVQIPIPNLVDGPLGQGVQVGQPAIFNTFLIQQPQTSTITLSTTVNVPDGGTVLLGGLKTMSEGRNEAGPPILSKIPYLSRLFRNVGWGRDGQSLMILVTPRIIINEEEERIFTGVDQPIPRP